MILGLVIALVGAIWQWRRSPAASPQVAALQSEVADLEQQLANVQQPRTPTARLAPDAKLLPDDGGPIKWNQGYLLGAGGDDRGIRISTIQATGQNESDEFIQPLSGYVRSEITGRQLPILVNDNGTLVPSDGYGIPAKHQFSIGAKLSDAGITGNEFLRDFGRLTFVFQYGTHTYTKHFAPEELEAEVRRTENDLRPKPIQGMAGVKRIQPLEQR